LNFIPIELYNGGFISQNFRIQFKSANLHNKWVIVKREYG